MHNPVSIYRNLYSAANELAENNNYDLAYRAFQNLLESLIKDRCPYPEDQMSIKELIVDVLFAMAKCQTSATNINPADTLEFSRNVDNLELAKKNILEALKHIESLTIEFHIGSMEGIQASLTTTLNTIELNSVGIKYNFGCTLLENSHREHMTVLQSLNNINKGFQYLLEALQSYNYLVKSTSIKFYQKAHHETKAVIHQKINSTLSLLGTNTALLEMKQNNVRYQKEFATIKDCYEKILSFIEMYPDEISPPLTRSLHEKMADIYSILSNDCK